VVVGVEIDKHNILFIVGDEGSQAHMVLPTSYLEGDPKPQIQGSEHSHNILF